MDWMETALHIFGWGQAGFIVTVTFMVGVSIPILKFVIDIFGDGKISYMLQLAGYITILAFFLMSYTPIVREASRFIGLKLL